MSDDGLIGLPKLLQLIPVTRHCIWKWHRAGKFPRPVRIGRRVAWVRAEVEAWLAERKGDRCHDKR